MKHVLDAIKRLRGAPLEKRGEVSERAPELSQSAEEMPEGDPAEGAEIPDVSMMSDEQKTKLLEALLSDPMGRSPQGLRERASGKISEDLAALKNK